MNCKKIRPLLSPYIDGQVSREVAGLIEEHLERCEACRAELFDLRESVGALRRLPSDDPGPEFNAKVMAGFASRSEKRTRAHRLQFRLAMGLACVLLLVSAAIPIYVAGMKHFVGRQDIYVIGADSLIPGSTASVRVVVASRGADSPMEGAWVNLILARDRSLRRVKLMSGKTDEAGTLEGRFRVPDDLSGDWRLVATASSGLGRNSLTVPVKLTRAAKAMLTTDKPIYQPGQTIHLRALALLRPSLKPAGGDEIRFVVEDPKDNKVFDETVAASEWGVASAEFQLGQEIILGRYTVKAVLGETETRRTVTVKRYVLPKFKVSLETDRTYYLPGETIRGTVSARYFFGKPAAGAKVRVGLSALNVNFEPFAEITGRTNAEGTFTFEARVPGFLAGQPVAKGNALVKLVTTVVDTASHQEEIVRTVPVAKSPIVIALVPESGEFVPGLENVVYVATSYPDGRPARAEVALELDRAVQRAESDALGVSEFRITPSQGKLTLRASARSAAGEIASESFSFDPLPNVPWLDQYAMRDRESPGVMSPAGLGGVLIRSDKAVYDVGDTADVVILSTRRSGSVYLDAVLDGQTVLTQTARLERGRAEIALDLTDREAGTLTLSAYVLSPVGVPVRDTMTVFVRPGKELNVEVKSARESYRPGERARLDFRVTNREGRAVAAAIGVNVVDESVFSVEEQMPGLAALYFALQEDILKPRYQTKFVTEEDIYREGWRDPEGTARKMQQQMLARKLQIAGILPDWNDPNALLASDRPGTIQRAAKVLFASAAMPDPRISAVTQVEKDRRIEEIQRRFFGADGAQGLLVIYVLTVGVVVVLAIVRRSRAGIVCAAVSLGAVVAVVVTGLVGAMGGATPLSEWVHVAGLWTFGPFWLASVVAVSRDRSRLSGAQGIVANAIVVLVILAVLAVVLFPVFARARRAAMAGSAMGNMRQLGAALGIYWNDYDAQLPKAQGRAGGPARIRQFFPETLYSNPAVITDDSGRASLDVPLADSITTWRVSALASSMNGEVGSANAPLRVFQEFFADLDLPVAVTQGDVISVPVAVYNYLPEARKITLTLRREAWFEATGTMTKGTSLGPNEVGVVYFPIRANRLGRHSLTVGADSGTFGDAVRREITVHPNGQERSGLVSGVVDEDTRARVEIPRWAIPGASKLLVKVYPGVLSQVVDGLEGILHAPYGCFEQTSSITYPNVLVLKYLQATKKDRPEISMKAEQFISLGYQRLLTFEVPGGGFDWFGQAPANTVLTAYGVMELADMADVATVDKRLIDRAFRLLESRQRDDGSWGPDVTTHTWESLGSDLTVTAYVTWALAEGGFGNTPSVRAGAAYLSERLDQARDPYTLALIANALVACEERPQEAERVLERLADTAQVHGDRATWKGSARTLTYGLGGVARTETTALAAYAFLRSHIHPELAKQAINELVATKDSLGSWHTTQATILALKALLAGATEALGGSGSVEITVNGSRAETVNLRGGDSDVVRTIDVTDLARPGANVVEMRAIGRARPAFQVVARYYAPWSRVTKPDAGDLSIDVRYGKLRVERDGVVDVTATVRANEPVQMAMVDLGLPPGFAVVSEDLEALKARRVIERAEVTPRQVILYLRGLNPGYPVTIRYRLRALYPVRATIPASRAYDYYNPESRRTFARPVVVEVL